MNQWFVEYEVRCHNAIGAWYLKSDVVEATDVDDALTVFKEKHKDKFDFRFPSRCEKTVFAPTHRYLNIQSNEWEKVEFVKNIDTCDAYVKKMDGKLWHVGRMFLEQINAS